MSKKFEITVMAENPGGQMIMMDRCVLRAQDTADAARQYAQLFPSNQPDPGERGRCADCGDNMTVAADGDGRRLCLDCARDIAANAPVTWDEDAPQEGRP
jgi:hypothetical protein